MNAIRGWLRHWCSLVLDQPIAFVATLLLGGAISFGYSYLPLQGQHLRRIERLEGELATETTRALEITTALAAMERDARGRPAADEIAALRRNHREAVERVGKLERDLSGRKARIRRLERERSEHMRRIAALQADLEASLALDGEVAPEPPAPEPADELPAAPAPPRRAQ